MSIIDLRRVYALVILILFVLIREGQGLFGVVYLQIQPKTGVTVIKNGDTYYSNMDKASYETINKVRQSSSRYKQLPQIPLRFDQLEIPQLIKFELFLSQRNSIVDSGNSQDKKQQIEKQVRIPLYLHITPTTSKNICNQNKSKRKSIRTVSCISLQKQRQGSQNRKCECHPCYFERYEQVRQINGIRSHIRRCIDMIIKQNKIQQFLKIDLSASAAQQKDRINAELSVQTNQNIGYMAHILFKVIFVGAMLFTLVYWYNKQNTYDPSHI